MKQLSPARNSHDPFSSTLSLASLFSPFRSYDVLRRSMYHRRALSLKRTRSDSMHTSTYRKYRCQLPAAQVWTLLCASGIHRSTPSSSSSLLSTTYVRRMIEHDDDHWRTHLSNYRLQEKRVSSNSVGETDERYTPRYCYFPLALWRGLIMLDRRGRERKVLEGWNIRSRVEKRCCLLRACCLLFSRRLYYSSTSFPKILWSNLREEENLGNCLELLVN